MSGITNTKIFGIRMTSSRGNPSPSSAVLPAAGDKTGTLALCGPITFSEAGEWHCGLFVSHYLKEARIMPVFCQLWTEGAAETMIPQCPDSLFVT